MPNHPHILLDLPATTLLELGNALTKGALRFGFSAGSLSPFAGSRSAELAAALQRFTDAGCSLGALGQMCFVLHDAAKRIESAEKSVFPTLSGPEVPGTPVTPTPMIVRALFEEAEHEVIVASYVFHQCADILAPLAEKMETLPDFRVRFIVDLSHQRQQESEPMPVVANRFKAHFLNSYWPGARPPEFWHDPRVFQEKDRAKAGIMHAKLVIIDKRAALVTSANFTQAAQQRNMEAGIMIRRDVLAIRLSNYFEGLMNMGLLKKIE